MRLLDVQISSKNYDIAWCHFETEEIVREIFKQSAVVQSDSLNMFPVIPELGLNRKKDIELRLKSLQRIDDKLRYQVRLGENDFRIFLKIYIKGEYVAFRECPIEYIDPNENVRDFKTITTNIEPDEEDEHLGDEKDTEPTQWNDVLSKRTRKRFMAQKKLQNKFVSDTQIIEFLHAYLNGTKVSPWAHFLEKSPEETIMELEEIPALEAAPAGPSRL